MQERLAAYLIVEHADVLPLGLSSIRRGFLGELSLRAFPWQGQGGQKYEIVRKPRPMTRNDGVRYVKLTFILREELASSEKNANGPSGVVVG